MAEKNMSEEEYLKQHIESLESTNKSTGGFFDNLATPTQASGTRTTDLQFLSFDIKELPCGKFYPQGTTFMIRAAQVKEIQSY